ncbi:CaiB/BaiF CoA transferase family protein [Ammoniphilus resinae]|uniref:Crotonobetainyl-CoA:carnitine CoA-transferase CaiB-like acyl-CoA transferase n=1 Tax=Ammoniphilus resinae TaxID=861532 RepID=A0ABS4GW00_9BACL|nr:CaiB/BaiF CoA-transferase family protein [Ammoniphilus resinae]MBP1934463.1 crotonobetainyl-CoA:carnitine CoA-transferase CaiB-like acyl-CoA transferase [Ammoniphilus resinae]
MTKGPLEGMKIVDFSQMMAGPFGTQMLGDLGADIIKIERPTTGEWERGLASMGELCAGDSPFFLAMNRNKRSLTLDLKHEKSKEIIYKLVADADVVIENFRPGVLDRLGYGYEDFSKINPGIIYCSSTGYGSSGPYTKRPGQDLLIQGISGLIDCTGTKDQAVPMGTAVVDASTAMMNVISILAAYTHKQKTGEGQRIEVNMFSTAISIQCQEAFSYLNLDQRWERSEAGIGAPWLSAPFGVYPTKDGFMTLAMNSVPLLGKIMGLSELESYQDGMDCFTDRDFIKRRLETKTIEKTTAEWLSILAEYDIWCGPVNTLGEVFEDPQVIHNHVLQTMHHPKAGEIKVVGFPGKFSKTPATYRMHPPLIGQHNAEILKSLGYSEEEIASFQIDGVTELKK